MIYIDKQSNDPWFNIAAEEVALKSKSEDILMLWINNPSVVVGKHQNTFAEVNQQFVWEHNIPVIRRLSGGGTVYHDQGNLNYSLITTVENRERLIDFPKFTKPVFQFLKQFGLDVTFYGKTNLGVVGKKFSGNAAHIFKNRVLHHGTLLLNTNLDILEQTIGSSDADIMDKSIKSVRASIINLKELVPGIKSVTSFQQQFKQFLFDYFSIADSIVFSENETQEINYLVQKKYNNTDWNYGYSPAYQFSKTMQFNGENVKIHMEVKKGIIVDLQINSDKIPNQIINLIQNQLINKQHNPQAMIKEIAKLTNHINVAGMDGSFLFKLII